MSRILRARGLLSPLTHICKENVLYEAQIHFLWSWLCLPPSSTPIYLSAQEPNPTANTAPNGGLSSGVDANGNPIFIVKTVERDLPAVNYFHRSGSTKVGLKGTDLMPGAKGEANVQSERGRITVGVEYEGLTPANGFLGNEYLDVCAVGHLSRWPSGEPR